MYYRLLLFYLIFSTVAKGQSCELLRKTFAIADTIKVKEGDLYRFRFSGGQLDALLQLPGLEKPVTALKNLQKTLDEDNASLQNGILWQLDGKLAEKQFAQLRKECPETGFAVFWREIVYYKSKFQKKEDQR